jgi:hypothetical protein
LDNDSVIRPRTITTDTEADSDIVNGLFRLPGYQFTPRLADLPDRRYWRLDPRADYGLLNQVAVHRINRRLVEAQWADICRAAGTLHTRAAAASELIRALQRGGQPSPLAKAIGEIGRVVRAVTMLDYGEYRFDLARQPGLRPLGSPLTALPPTFWPVTTGTPRRGPDPRCTSAYLWLAARAVRRAGPATAPLVRPQRSTVPTCAFWAEGPNPEGALFDRCLQRCALKFRTKLMY